MNIGSKSVFTLILIFGYQFLSGCAGPPRKVAAPPEIIRVPQYMPLPDDCGILWPADLPAGSSAADVMDKLKAVAEAYRDQVQRCFGASNGN